MIYYQRAHRQGLHGLRGLQGFRAYTALKALGHRAYRDLGLSVAVWAQGYSRM